MARISRFLTERFERFDYGDTDYYTFLFDQSVYHFGVSIENTYEERNKQGERLHKLEKLLEDEHQTTNPSIFEAQSFFAQLATNIEVSGSVPPV